MNDDLPTSTEAEGATLDLPEGLRTFTPGQVLGDRYQILEVLGRGGMGEVWHAFDLKLRVEVALKALRPEFFKSERRLEMLRQEVRAAREVMSPNVCRIFDLIEVEGRELVSMEYVDGATLLDVLQERGPLELEEAQDIASQFLAGLEAIHKAGLVHRDVKPENIMLTRAGRVVVMDFGLARQETEGGGTVAGTPAYMAPEQAAGLQVDARADVYAAGVVLAEMVCPEGIKNIHSRQSVWEAVRSEPAKVPDTPWAPVIQKAVRKDREQRYNSAHTLIRELEDVTLRVEGAEDLHPYPGLASFTEADAEYFFGREAEIERMWRKLDQPHLLAIVGPSGSGKTSFIRAGLIPSAGTGWAIATCTPGNSAFASLRRALASEIGDDSAAVGELAVGDPDSTVSACSRWRRRHDQALLIVDQFEELFTLNDAEQQRDFAKLLERLALEADVFVLLSMRDDFLLRCRDHEPLEPIFSDLTALPTLAGSALRRALVQPAAKCGYRFEDDELVDEMLADVEGERGALPLLAFAAARVWEERDRENGLLMRQSYNDIGGVAGALARHAESTIDRIGHENLPVVRELFRNLVTAEGTRAVREWDDLLSIFRDSRSESQAEEVLRALIDARLLTSYEVREEDKAPTRRIEIIHESLLANWPRLVGWQTQDADSARMRDELRQAARSWEEHGRHEDRLWTGTAFREYQVWRERYPGGLTETEEAFGSAMTRHANRRRRRRRAAIAAGVAALVVVLAVVTGLWRKSVRETRRAEAQKLLVLGQSAFAEERTRALAYAIASLGLADTPEARRLALKALWAGPPATLVPEGGVHAVFSPDGRYLVNGNWGGRIRVNSRDGGQPVPLHGFEGGGKLYFPNFSFSPDSRLVVAGGELLMSDEVRVWDARSGEQVRTIQVPDVGDGGVAYGALETDGASVLTVGFTPGDPGRWLLDRWFLDGGPPERLGSVPGTIGRAGPIAVPDLSRGLIAVPYGDELHLYRIDSFGGEPPRVVARASGDWRFGRWPVFDPVVDRVALFDTDGCSIRLWPLDGDGSGPSLVLDTGQEASLGVRDVAFSADGSYIAAATDGEGRDGFLWDLRGPATARPLGFGCGLDEMVDVTFSPDSRWMTTAGGGMGRALWPLDDRYPRVLSQDEGGAVQGMVFAADGSRLFVGRADGVQSWSLGAGAGEKPEYIYRGAMSFQSPPDVDPLGRFLIAPSAEGLVKVPLDGSPATVLVESAPWGNLGPAGRLLAFPNRVSGKLIIVVLDLETGRRWEVAPPGNGVIQPWQHTFDSEGRLLVVLGGVLSRSDLEAGTTEVLVSEGVNCVTCTRCSRGLLVETEDSKFFFLDPHDGTRTELPFYGRTYGFAVDPSLDILARGYEDGSIRVESLSGGEPHLILGTRGTPGDVRISPDGRWVVALTPSGITLWPMPDLSRPPLNTLPHDELMATLEAMTNLRAVPDEESSTGWKLTVGPFPGWAEVPTW